MQSENQSKVSALKAVMGNPKLAKTIQEGFNAPIGSTKREQARSILSIIKKIDSSGNSNGISFHQPTPKVEDNNPYSIIYKKAFEEKKADGKGGAPLFSYAPPVLNTGSQLMLKRTVTPSFGANFSLSQPSPSSSLSSLNNPNAIAAWNKTGLSTSSIKTDPSTFFSSNYGPSSLSLSGAGINPNANLQQVLSSGVKFGAQPIVATPKETAQTPAALGIGNEQYGPNQNPNPDAGSGYTGPSGDSSSAMIGDLSSGLQTKFKSSMTGGMFATSVLGDRNQLREMGVPESQIPFAAGLQGQVDALADRLKEEYKLDELGNQYKELMNSNATFSTDLTDYIKGRDTYIESVNGMIDSVKSSMKTGLSDPGTVAANKTYIDYLSVLKGRQNNRYIDLLNNSIERHDAKLKMIADDYNSKFAMYKEELAQGTAITTATYNQMYTDLSNAWTLYSQGPALALQADKLRADTAKTWAESLKITAEAGGSTGGGKGFIEEAKKISSEFMDTSAAGGGKFFPNINLKAKLEAALANGTSLNAINYLMQTGVQNTAGAGLDDVDNLKRQLASFKEKDNQGVSIDQMMVDHGYVDSKTGQPLSFSDDMLAALNQSSYKSVNSTIAGASTDIKAAIDWLVKYDAKKISGKKADFIKSFGGKNIDSRVLSALWDYYVTTVTSNPNFDKDKNSRQSIFKTDAMGVLDAGNLSTQLLGYLVK